jgi:peptide/nickel transport system substrate-binding protein
MIKRSSSRSIVLLHQYATTSDPAVQKQAIQGLQKIVVEQLPVIPLLFDVAWAEYNSTNYVDWPAPGNPYAPPANFYSPDLAYILLHLKPAA